MLIPEVPFELDGEKDLSKTLENRLKAEGGHAVILVAEGAGQELMKQDGQEKKRPLRQCPAPRYRAVSENAIDVYFHRINMEINLKYIEPVLPDPFRAGQLLGQSVLQFPWAVLRSRRHGRENRPARSVEKG